VADRYIDLAYVQACLEDTIADSLADDLDDLNLLIEDASGEVAALLRNSGYDLPTAPITVADVHPVIRSATMCGVWERLAMRPKYSLTLPDNWAEMPYRRALDGIESGDLVLGSGQSSDTAPGAWLFTEITSKTGGTKLSGY
jgi:hypothetical protein